MTDIPDPTCAFHGLKRSEHRCLYCALCFRDLTFETCHVRSDGRREDICNDCAYKESLNDRHP